MNIVDLFDGCIMTETAMPNTITKGAAISNATTTGVAMLSAVTTTCCPRSVSSSENTCLTEVALRDTIKRVIFNDPATIVYWTDGTKTIVKAQGNETFDKEKGLALAFMKKWTGNRGNFNNILRKYCLDAGGSDGKKV